MEKAWVFALSSVLLIPAVQSPAQDNAPWQMESSNTKASLRGIDSVDGAVAWASGTDGTVLKTVDGGAHWEKCVVPDADKDGATLDFRGVQAWDARTAMVMASGPGAKSRLYKTTDGCGTWALLFANPDAPNGFFDSFWLNGSRGILLGDPVREQLAVFITENNGKTWKRDEHGGLSIHGRSLAAFAASNSSIPIGNGLFTRAFVTGGKSGSVFFSRPFTQQEEQHGMIDRLVRKEPPWKSSPIPVASGSDSAGAFSVAYRYPVTIGVCAECTFNDNSLFVAVGGDYTKPNESVSTAAWSADGGAQWTAATTPPHGYRSAVQWSDSLTIWVTVGTNGSDVSRDDGKTWERLDDGNWNALSLPFVVGSNGRIAKLNAAAIQTR
jgi:photosystem II stability/assembly factor-like uncharacterized protein